MRRKKTAVVWTLLAFCGLFLTADLAVQAQSGPPPLPPDPWLNIFEFPTNFTTAFGDAPPLAYTNIASVPVWQGNALVLEMTNARPAYLQYRLNETNGHLNLSLSVGTIFFLYTPNWSSADSVQLGTGPGQRGYLLGTGDWRSNAPYGFLGLFTDAGGTNIYLAGISNGVSTTYVSAPISWGTNEWHQIDAEYSPSNSFLYLDGGLAATGTGVTIIPATNVWTNGFFIGSDSSGYEQARGAFWRMETWDEQLFGDYTNSWAYRSNEIATWQGGGGFTPMVMGGLGSLIPTNGCGCACVSNTGVYLTNITAVLVNGTNMTFSFAIEGGSNGLGYDVFSATQLSDNPASTVWTWLGTGTNCGGYTIENESTNATYYVLGGPQLASDGSGLTVAYESLIGSAWSSDGYSTPNAWYLWQGINPQISGVATQDPDGDGLLNWQEYLYGTNPQVSEGFAVWVSEPNGTSGLP